MQPSCVVDELQDEPEVAEAQQEQQPPAADAAAAPHAAAPEQQQQQQQPEPAAPPGAAASGEPASAEGQAEEGECDAAWREAVAAAEALKAEGNAAYAAEDWDGALSLYWQAVDAAPEGAAERAVYHCNAAAAYLKKQAWQDAVEQCTAALKINATYIKALVRRCTALQALDDVEHALADAQRVLELDPGNAWAASSAAALAPAVAARQEALKAEMLGKLKDLGNSVLGKFGLSLDNFKAEQDPETGGYSIKFSQ
ncbi:Ttc1 [Scenedesmus sp. PABB004]|nr:Ttc1 [Scenedesmus sp. PABB004]